MFQKMTLYILQTLCKKLKGKLSGKIVFLEFFIHKPEQKARESLFNLKQNELQPPYKKPSQWLLDTPHSPLRPLPPRSEQHMTNS